MNIKKLAGLAFLAALCLQPTSSAGLGFRDGTRYEGFLVELVEGEFKLQKRQTVAFSIVNGEVKDVRVRLKDATKDLTFGEFFDVARDGSDFAGWFEKESRHLGSADGSPVTYEAFLAGAYAAVSPVVAEGYSMYEKLKEIAGRLGIDTPHRTFVIYSVERRPIYEFFCYEAGK
jgi:hypothetical protein